MQRRRQRAVEREMGGIDHGMVAQARPGHRDRHGRPVPELGREPRRRRVRAGRDHRHAALEAQPPERPHRALVVQVRARRAPVGVGLGVPDQGLEVLGRGHRHRIVHDRASRTTAPPGRNPPARCQTGQKWHQSGRLMPLMGQKCLRPTIFIRCQRLATDFLVRCLSRAWIRRKCLGLGMPPPLNGLAEAVVDSSLINRASRFVSACDRVRPVKFP
jgi:hypothetical protein